MLAARAPLAHQRNLHRRAQGRRAVRRRVRRQRLFRNRARTGPDRPAVDAVDGGRQQPDIGENGHAADHVRFVVHNPDAVPQGEPAQRRLIRSGNDKKPLRGFGRAQRLRCLGPEQREDRQGLGGGARFRDGEEGAVGNFGSAYPAHGVRIGIFDERRPAGRCGRAQGPCAERRSARADHENPGCPAGQGLRRRFDLRQVVVAKCVAHQRRAGRVLVAQP